MEKPISEINISFTLLFLDDIDLESFGKKKKKKKNRDTMDMDDLEEALPDEDGVSKFEVYIFSNVTKKSSLYISMRGFLALIRFF